MAGHVGRRTVWGLDIASSAIKGVKMRLVEGRPEIVEADIAPLEGPPASKKNPGRDRRIWQALQRFRQKHEIGSEDVIAGLPGRCFFTRAFNVFVVGTRTESELVRYELEQHIPFGLDAVLWDHEAFPPTGPSDRELNGLLFAMKKDVLNDYLLSLSAAEVEPREIQAAPVALQSFIRYEMNPQEPTLVVDIGAEGTTLLVIHGARYWLRTLSVGVNGTTEALQRAFLPEEISREQAEAIKLNLSSLKRRAEVVELLEPSLRRYVGELRNGLRHLVQEHRVRFEKLVLVGGGAHLCGISRMIAEGLKIRTATPAGLGRIAIAPSARPAYVNRHVASFATAIGLGLQGLGLASTRVNVMGATLMRRRSQTLYRRAAVAGVIFLALFTGILGGFSSWRKATLTEATERLSKPLSTLAQRNRLWKKASRQSQAEARMNEFVKLAAQRGAWLTVMDKVAKILPENDRPTTPRRERVWLLNLDVSAPDIEGNLLKGILEVATPLRPQGTHLRYLKTRVMLPLVEDERKLFQNVRIVESKHGSQLSWSDDGGVKRYLLLRLKFDIDIEKLR